MKWHNTLIFIFTVLTAASLLLSYAAQYISPQKAWWLAYFGLAYLPVVLFNFLLLVYWLFVNRKVFFVLLLFLLAGFGAHKNAFAFSPGPEKQENNITLLTWNVKGLDAFHPDTPFENRNAMLDVIAGVHADIICLQEFNTYQNESPERKNLDELKQRTGLQHVYYYKAYENKKKTRSFGLLILSRFPIQNTGVVNYETVSKLNASIFADITIDSVVVRLFTVHLQSTQLTHHDLEFIDPIEGSGNTNFDTEKVMHKLSSAFRLRAVQADSVRSTMDQSPYPAIICGDFNDTPVSYTYHTISKNMQDAFLQSGTGIGNTFVTLPFLRIDYMLFDTEAFTIDEFMRVNTKTSDHYPCVTKFRVTATAKD
jgi:endonuclease/exonuclease/phosphatase family metal-dependent hydrolase